MPDDLTTVLTDYYDAVPYDSHPFPQTAAEHLEALAFLFGLESKPPAQARVLELGCASGGNLLPFAARHPQGSGLGVDLSSVQVAQGVHAIGQTRLGNVELRAFDISQIDASFGLFDYIICHGVYSWVPPSVQDAILRVCSENLAPQGVAYVSYNVYPGWKAREIVRDAMILRGGPRELPAEKLAYARGMLDFLEESARPDSVLKKTLEETLPLVRTGNSSYLIHEFLEPCNAPCYFKQFVERAGSHGLAYLADAEPSTMYVQNYGEKVREPLLRECGGSQIMIEQYLDFLVNRTFRQTLLVKQERAGGIRYGTDLARLRALSYAGVFRPDDGAAIALDGPEQRCTAIRNIKVSLRVPLHKVVAQVLDRHYPAAVPPEVLVAEVCRHTGAPAAQVEAPVMALLEELLILGAVRVRLSPVELAAQVSAKPRALPAVRLDPGLPLSAGPSASACNLWHEQVALSPIERCLLPLLDGAHDHDALAEHLVGEARADRLSFHADGAPLRDPGALRPFADQQVARALEDLRRKGVLTA